MKYTGEFMGRQGNVYTLDIITNGDSSTSREVTLGVPPFVIQMEESENTLYKPVKYQSGTAKIISEDYNFDIYSDTAQGTKVTLTETKDSNGSSVSRLRWTGYVTPNLYNMGFDEDREEIEIECIDALSTLQYYKYEPLGESKGIVRIIDVLDSILAKCNAYTKYYISTNMQLKSNSQEDTLSKIYISEENFYEQKDDDNQTDSDVAWTCQEVLEEICQYFGLTCVARGQYLYFIDYDAIKNQVDTYYSHTIGSPNTTTIQATAKNIAIDGDSYRENGATLSLDNVYNKITVTDDMYKYDSVLPDMWSGATNITVDDSRIKGTGQDWTGYYGMKGEFIDSDAGQIAGDSNKGMLVFIDRVDGVQNDDIYNAIFVKYYHSPNYKLYKYDSNLNDVTANYTNSMNYSTTRGLNGAFLAKMDVQKLSESAVNSWIDQMVAQSIGYDKSLDDFLAENEISKVNLSDCILFLNPANNHIDNTQVQNYPYLETTTSIDTTALFGGENAYLVISGKVSWHYMSEDPYPIPDGEVDIDNGRKKQSCKNAYLLAKLQWGDLYWNGEEWTNTNSTFPIYYVKSSTSGDDARADNLMFKNLNIVNTVSWRYGLEDTGYCIPLPSSGNGSYRVVAGTPLLTIYKPMDFNGYKDYKTNVMVLKNFEIKAVIGDPTFSDANDSDTTYTNIINNDFVNDFDEVKFKICTWDNKKPNYNSLAYLGDDGQYYFVDKLYSLALSEEANGTIRYDGSISDGSLRAEEWLVYRLCKQYSEPAIKLELSLKNDTTNYLFPFMKLTDATLTDRYFILDSFDLDFKDDTLNVRLIEKK